MLLLSENYYYCYTTHFSDFVIEYLPDEQTRLYEVDVTL